MRHCFERYIDYRMTFPLAKRETVMFFYGWQFLFKILVWLAYIDAICSKFTFISSTKCLLFPTWISVWNAKTSTDKTKTQKDPCERLWTLSLFLFSFELSGYARCSIAHPPWLFDGKLPQMYHFSCFQSLLSESSLMLRSASFLDLLLNWDDDIISTVDKKTFGWPKYFLCKSYISRPWKRGTVKATNINK